ncbi:MAG: hypothetical protein WBL45_11040 [Solirubrobacterales bacterium]
MPAANAATLAVDDDRAQCPAAQFTSIQAAVDAAAPGDTVTVCPGRYVEGSGAPGTNALTIAKDLNIRGAGADVVAIQPRRSTPTGGQIAEGRMDIRNGVGDIVSIQGGTAVPVTVNISGVTVDGNGVFAEAGIVYLDAQGSLVRDRVTNIVTSISNGADNIPGGYRSNQFGFGIAQVTAADSRPPGAGPRTLTIDHTRVDRYNKVGILIDGSTGANLPLTPSGVVNSGVLVGNQVVGRVQCKAFNTPTPPPFILGGLGATPVLDLPGNCDTISATTVGPTFGQDGIRVTAGSTISVTDSTISQNYVNGIGAPLFNSVTNNANLSQGAGIRLIGAGPSTIVNSNLTANAFGIFSVGLDGVTPNQATPVAASSNWWGLRVTQDNTGNGRNLGPAISPTTNPRYQETAVNGAPTPDGAGTTSTAVDFFPFRDGNQADPNTGQLPVVYAPLPVNDTGPSIELSTGKAEYDRGEMVRMTAAAADDFGVTSISFFNGTELVGQVTPPANTASFAIPANALCAVRGLSAVASDYLGQTGSASAEIEVTGPAACQQEPAQPPDKALPPGPPSVTLTGLPAEIGQGGATVSADPRADTARGANVAKVDFYLGERLLCSVTSAPYSCSVMPLGSEAGAQALRAVVTDSTSQTAAGNATVTVSRFRTNGLSVKVLSKGTAKRKLARIVKGTLSLPDRVSPAEGCASGTVSVTVKRNGSTVFPSTQVPLARNCTYKLKFTVSKSNKKSRFRATARFGGNAVLQPVSHHRRSR